MARYAAAAMLSAPSVAKAVRRRSPRRSPRTASATATTGRSASAGSLQSAAATKSAGAATRRIGRLAPSSVAASRARRKKSEKERSVTPPSQAMTSAWMGWTAKRSAATSGPAATCPFGRPGGAVGDGGDADLLPSRFAPGAHQRTRRR